METARKAKKPVNITNGLEDSLSAMSALPIVLQQVIFLSLDLIFPVLIVQSIMGSSQLAQSFISLTMLAMGAGTVMQSFKQGPIGSGYFCAQETGAIYFSASLLAMQKGGFPLLFGMTAIAGVVEVLLAKIIHKFRVVFPTELAGLVVIMLGVSFIPISIALFCGSETLRGRIDVTALHAGVITLAITIAINVWGKGAFRQYSIVVGIVVGYLYSYLLGILTKEHLLQVMQAPVLSFPDTSHIGWAYDSTLVVPFLVAVVGSSLKTIANVTTCQKANDFNWTRMDMRSIRGGLVADGLSTLLAGLIGGMGLNSSSGSVGLSIATGVTSRRIGFVVGGMFVLLAFLPKVSALFAIMPKPVMGAILIVVTTFILVTGFQIVFSRMLDTRKSFVIGLALIFGLSVDIMPDLYTSVPLALTPLFASSFSLATLVAICLNLLFRIGIAQSQTIEFQPGKVTSETVFDFLEQAGASWGARREIVNKAMATLNEFIESAATLELVDDSVKVVASFDEYNLDLDMYYQGNAMEFPVSRPSDADLMEDDRAFIRLSGFMIRKYADKIETENSNGIVHVKFHFEH